MGPDVVSTGNDQQFQEAIEAQRLVAKLSAAANERASSDAWGKDNAQRKHGVRSATGPVRCEALWEVEVGSYLVHMMDQPTGHTTNHARRPPSAPQTRRGSRTPSPIRDIWKEFKARFRQRQKCLDARNGPQNAACKAPNPEGGVNVSEVAGPSASSVATSPKLRPSSPIWETMKGAFKRNRKKITSDLVSDEWFTDASEVTQGAVARAPSEQESCGGRMSRGQVWNDVECTSPSSFLVSLAATGVPLDTSEHGTTYIDPEDALRLLCENLDPRSGTLSPDRSFSRRESSSSSEPVNKNVRDPPCTSKSCQEFQPTIAAAAGATASADRAVLHKRTEQDAQPSALRLEEIPAVPKLPDSKHHEAVTIAAVPDQTDGDKRELRLRKAQLKSQLEATKSALQQKLNRMRSEVAAKAEQNISTRRSTAIHDVDLPHSQADCKIVVPYY